MKFHKMLNFRLKTLKLAEAAHVFLCYQEAFTGNKLSNAQLKIKNSCQKKKNNTVLDHSSYIFVIKHPL